MLPAASPKKKILYLALCDPDLSVTGVTVRMGAFVKHLSAFYDIDLVNITGSGHEAAPLPSPTATDAVVQRRVQVPFSQAGYFLFSRQFYRAAKSLIKNNTYNYLVADYGLAAVYGIRLSKKYNLPLLYFSSNVEYRMYMELGRHDPRRWLLAPYMYWAEKTACKRAHVVATVSDRDRQAYAQWIDPNKIIAIPQGFDPHIMNPFSPLCSEIAELPSSKASALESPIILFTGSFRDENNRQAARYIAQTLAPQVANAIPQAKFQLIGSSPPPDIAGSSPNSNLECLGFVQDIAPYIRRANLVIAPMPFGHGISTKVVLGLAYGKTVLTTPPVAGGMPRHYEQLQVTPLEQFAQRLVEILQTVPTTSTKGFESLCKDLAWPDLMTQLYQKIEGIESIPVSPLTATYQTQLTRSR